MRGIEGGPRVTTDRMAPERRGGDGWPDGKGTAV